MSKKYQLRSADVEWQNIGDETVGVDIRTGEYLSLNGSAGVLVPHLKEGATIETLSNALVERFGIDAERATSDASAFVHGLEERDLLEQ